MSPKSIASMCLIDHMIDSTVFPWTCFLICSLSNMAKSALPHCKLVITGRGLNHPSAYTASRLSNADSL